LSGNKNPIKKALTGFIHLPNLKGIPVLSKNYQFTYTDHFILQFACHCFAADGLSENAVLDDSDTLNIKMKLTGSNVVLCWK